MKPLSAGARVAVVATGGLFNRQKVEAGTAWLRSLGLEAVAGRHLLAKDLLFAGTVEERVQDLAAALADGSIEAIWCARGGYGSYAVAQALAARAPSGEGKPLIGHSDVTALHLLWSRWAGRRCTPPAWTASATPKPLARSAPCSSRCFSAAKRRPWARCGR